MTTIILMPKGKRILHEPDIEALLWTRSIPEGASMSEGQILQGRRAEVASSPHNMKPCREETMLRHPRLLPVEAGSGRVGAKSPAALERTSITTNLMSSPRIPKSSMVKRFQMSKSMIKFTDLGRCVDESHFTLRSLCMASNTSERSLIR